MIERLILEGSLYNENYARKVLPFLKDEYFDQTAYIVAHQQIQKHVHKYNRLPTKEALLISLDEISSLNENQYKEAVTLIESLSNDTKIDYDWLADKTEKFCLDKAIYNAVRQSILILDDKVQGVDKGSIPKLLSDALGVSFDTHIGHDFIEQYMERYDFYHSKEEKIEFDIALLNDITKGGVSKKSLSIILAGTGAGKTLFMCHQAASSLMSGKNVLYITMEMAEERIAERIDANLLAIKVDDLKTLSRSEYANKIGKLKARTVGKLIIKEYPTSTAGAAHFRHLLNELRLKRNFIPDIIFIDYINICLSSRLKNANNINSYTYIKAIAEELRGLAVEFNVPVVSATQTTRSGFSNSDPGLEDTSESFGLPATADFMIALVTNEELEKLGQLMVKQLKNRWGDISSPKRFMVGIDRSRMRLFDVEQKAQDGVANEDKPLMDTTNFGQRQSEESDIVIDKGDDFRPKLGRMKKKFKDFSS